MTPADELRTAAEKLRALASAAAAASGSPHWRATRLMRELPDATYTTLGTVDGPPFLRGGGRGGPPAYVSAPIGDYIATMGPSVGLALADWLDQAARYHEAGIQAAGDVFRDDTAGRAAFLTTGPGAPSEHALVVARTINGEQR
ncbi:hypothetical protein [Streptomyces sp. XY006]|uniref:hypothetical protein n=1 Tax=Streptomyces sp. XY006 TaxID=2021410 RepID=UPI000B8C51E1|nr:hypothetical protein [Streptomyces sp. XY006]OXS35408.1 hypothetical protein CHR28_10395 [Streptomyces sp. XY006]